MGLDVVPRAAATRPSTTSASPPGSLPSTPPLSRFAVPSATRAGSLIGSTSPAPRDTVISRRAASRSPDPASNSWRCRPADHVGPLKLELAAGTYSVSWFDVDIRTTFAGDDLVIGRAGTATISSPVPGAHACVVHVSRRR